MIWIIKTHTITPLNLKKFKNNFNSPNKRKRAIARLHQPNSIKKDLNCQGKRERRKKILWVKEKAPSDKLDAINYSKCFFP